LVALHDGHRESKESWLEVLRGLKARGLREAPKLAVGDGALGFLEGFGRGVCRHARTTLLSA